MVWARTKLLIYDYVFEPVKDIRMSFVCKTPEKLYPKINELLRSVFNVPDAYVQEKAYSREMGKDAERFETEWELNKILDMYSYITIEVDLTGFSSGGEGKATIRIKSRLITEYPQDTIWQQNIIYEMFRRFWHKFYYHHKRMEYLNLARELVKSFETNVKSYVETLKA